MEDLLHRIWENLGDRVSGPMWLRLVFQPAMAVIFALRDGYKDARDGRPAYFWAVITTTGGRKDLVKDGWTSIAKVFFMAMLIDAIYQFIVQRWIYPLEIALVASVLAVLPYLIVRGPINRILRRLGVGKQEAEEEDA